MWESNPCTWIAFNNCLIKQHQKQDQTDQRLLRSCRHGKCVPLMKRPLFLPRCSVIPEATAGDGLVVSLVSNQSEGCKVCVAKKVVRGNVDCLQSHFWKLLLIVLYPAIFTRCCLLCSSATCSIGKQHSEFWNSRFSDVSSILGSPKITMSVTTSVNCTYNCSAPDMWCPKKLCSIVGSICIHVAFSPHLVNPQHWHVRKFLSKDYAKALKVLWSLSQEICFEHLSRLLYVILEAAHWAQLPWVIHASFVIKETCILLITLHI